MHPRVHVHNTSFLTTDVSAKGRCELLAFGRCVGVIGTRIMEEFVKRYAGVLHALGSSLHTLSWFLPASNESYEYALEGVSAATGILSVYHRKILNNGDKCDVEVRKQLPYWLAAVQQIDLLVELTLRRKGWDEDKKYAALSCIEGVKATLRLAALMGGKGCLLLDDGLAKASEKQNEAGICKAWEKMHLAHCALVRFRNENGGNWNKGEDKRRLDSFLQEQRQEGAHLRRSYRLLVGGEVLQILRPFVYALGITLHKKTSWKPWLVAFCLDIWGHTISSHKHHPVPWLPPVSKHLTDNRFLSQEEEEELGRRRLLWLFYLLREPCYARVTRKAIERVRQSTARTPLLHAPIGKFFDFIEEFQQYWSYISAS